MTKQQERKERRTVRLTPLAKGRGKTSLWAYGYDDFAQFLDMSVAAVRKAVARGQFDPGSLDSLYRYKLQRMVGEKA